MRPWYIWSKNPPLSFTHPEIAKQWHRTKNGPWKPTDFTARSGVKVWWRCPHGPDHVFQTRIATRTMSTGSGCPFCRGLKASITNSLASLFPAIAKEWDSTKNGKTTPKDVVAGSNKRAWWRCLKGHDWQSQISNRTEGHGCPYCTGRRVTPERALSKHCQDVRDYWHPVKNRGLAPSQVSTGSMRVVWWRCPKSKDHEWQAAVQTFVRSLSTSTRGCPYCRGLRVGKSNSLAFLYPEIASELHPTKNNGLKAEELSYGSFKKVWWQCKVDPQHVFQNHVSLRTGRGHGCPYCSGRRASDLNSLARCYPQIAKLWHKTKNEELSPRNTTYGSHKKVWWQCNKNKRHIWQAAVYSMTLDHLHCPYCTRHRR